jgi:deazaflavin-dependent oxidoreductase (nitroreductase family)
VITHHRPASRVRAGFLWLVHNTINRVTTPLARAGRGPWSLVRHTGRHSGRTYETPLLLARTDDGFVCELTYGPAVDWYRNIEAAGGCTVVYRSVEHLIDRVEPCSTADGLHAFGGTRAAVLRLLRRHEFRRLHSAGTP